MNFEWLKQHKKPVGLILTGVIILFLLQIYGYMQQNHIYHSKDGTLIAIKRDSLSQSLDVPLIVEVEQEGKIQAYNITLTLDGEVEEERLETSINEETDLLEEAIETVVENLEQNDDLVIMLPKKLYDGTELKWKRPSIATDFLLFLLCPLGVWYIYQNEKARESQKEKDAQEVIRRALPAFNDQILLFMNSGLIFHDAFLRIAEGCQSRPSLDAFGNLIVKIAQNARSSGKSIVSVMEESKKDVAMREYSRMVNIIADNQIKGVGLKEKLESESHLLWESRKASAMQKGKEIETKMTFPLAVLLLVVVMVTGIPAMMSM